MVQLTYFSELSWLSVLLIVGILLYIISYKTKISNIFLLLLAGIVAGRFVDFSPSFMAGFATFALIMIIFDSTSKFKLKEIETYYGPSIKLTLTFLFFTVIALTVFIFFLFNFSITLVFVSFSEDNITSGEVPTIRDEKIKAKSKDSKVKEKLNKKKINTIKAITVKNKKVKVNFIEGP